MLIVFQTTYSTRYRVQDDTARLLSAFQHPSSTPQCLTFWYHMYGSDIGTLNVLVEGLATNLKDLSSTLIWTKSGPKGNRWYQASETLTNLNSTTLYGWRVAFEGIVGKGYLGDIALDDISLSPSQCPPSRICDFETGLCEYQAVPDASWTRQQASNFSQYFISVDHTTSTSLGYFALATQTNAKYG